MPSNIKVRKRSKSRSNSTDINLLVNAESNDVYLEWDRNKIVKALREEGGVGERTAKKIAKSVEERVLKSDMEKIPTSLIRELVDNELFELGYQKKLEKQTQIGLPKADIDELIFSKNQENSNIGTNNPEAIQHSLSETILKQYSLQEVFSTEVAEAHRTGSIHVHDLGYPVRLYCSSHSLEYIKKYGLELDNLDSRSAPAKHARSLSVHLNTFLSSMQAYYAGALGIAHVNIMYAPYLVGMTDKQIYQEAQHLIFQASQNAFTRGGQALFIDFNIHTGIPGYLKNIKAVGPGGKYTGKTYGDYEEVALKFTHALLKVWGKGDAMGTPMAFPKCFDKDTPMFYWSDGYKSGSMQDIYESFVAGNDVKLPHPDGWVGVKDACLRPCGEEGIQIRLSNNIKLRSLADHKYWVVDDDGRVVEKMASRLAVGDILIYQDIDIPKSESYQTVDIMSLFRIKYPRFKMIENGEYVFLKDADSDGRIIGEFANADDYGIDPKLSVDEHMGSLLGYFVSEGSYKNNNIRISAVKDNIRYNISNLLDSLNLSFSRNDDRDFTIYNTMYGFLFKELMPGYINHASQKHVPNVIFSSPDSVKWSFIKSIFDGDGTYKSNHVSYCSASRNLVYGLRILLRSVGVYSTIYIFRVDGYNCDYYELVIQDKKDIKLLIENIKNRFGNFIQSECDGASRSWYAKIPTKHMSNSNCCAWIRHSEYVSRDRIGIKSVPEVWSNRIPLVVSDISSCNVDAVAVEVDNDDHTFITGDGVLTKNCDFHINEETFNNPEQKKVFDYACKIASNTGVIYFIFDRDEVTLSACCRLKTTVTDNYMIDHPESLRFTGFQNVTINLPQCAYRAKGDLKSFYNELDKAFELCVRAHLDKKEFISSLMGKPGSPLWQVGRIAKDGRPYIDLSAATYIIGIIGLNECLHYLVGKELHEDESTLWTGIRIVSYLYFMAKEAEQKYGLKFSIEESPAESASRRLAKIDKRNYEEAIVRGEDEQIYYTNSIHIRPDVNVDLLTRISWQAKFHKLIESGAIIHAFVGEKMPSPKSIANLVHKTYKNTDTAQLTISPEFTICNNCRRTIIGLRDQCQHCGAYNINGVEFGKFTEVVDDWDKKALSKL